MWNYLKTHLLPVFSEFVSPPPFTKYADVSYGEGPLRKMDLYVLNGNIEPRPTALLIHAGGWYMGDKTNFEMSVISKYLLAGFNVVNMNYTLTTEDPTTHWPAQIEDVNSVIRWIMSFSLDYGIITDRLVIEGGSSGGHLAVFAAAQFPVKPFPFKCVVVNIHGPSNLTLPDIREWMETLWFLNKRPYAGNELRYYNASPIAYMTENNKPYPIISVHGRNDELIPYSQSESLHKLLDQLGVKNKLITHNGTHAPISVGYIKLWWINARVFWWVLSNI